MQRLGARGSLLDDDVLAFEDHLQQSPRSGFVIDDEDHSVPLKPAPLLAAAQRRWFQRAAQAEITGVIGG
jgi:hypothetical protein